jgi:alcohol dehydrogenase, propanol-preferring
MHLPIKVDKRDFKNAAGGEGPHAALVSAASVSLVSFALRARYDNCIYQTADVQSTMYEQAFDYLRPGGSLLVVGLPAQAQIGASIFWTVVKSINIIGSYVGCEYICLRGTE